jgi:hypothetical protein
MTHHQMDEGEVGGLLRIIGSIATIIALYTGMTWYVFHIYFGQVMVKLSAVEQHIQASAEWKMNHSKEDGSMQEKIVSLEKRVDGVELQVNRRLLKDRMAQ